MAQRPPRPRKRPRVFGDRYLAVSRIGVKSRDKLNEALGRRPVGLPAAVLVVGLALVTAASFLSPGGGNGPEGEGSMELLWAVSLLYGLGGVLILAGVGGLVSALVVHIAKKRGR